MAETRSLIIVCVFLCTLIVSNTLMCTAQKVDNICELVVEAMPADGISIVKTGPLKLVGLCGNEKSCDKECSKRTDTAGKTKKGKSGKCIDSGVRSPHSLFPGMKVPDLLGCACCRVL
ncbi:hypothetical protein MKW98_006128 [Papaver atlanticum]|uniref:Uncharacterized protein n=1 Tax=Papaver atlanticum TaxID=357466 RepID=A0AAD4TDR1_9MAGN|nr:hypothetical protein MKW98_006128 [Papaver atlanticum]